MGREGFLRVVTALVASAAVATTASAVDLSQQPALQKGRWTHAVPIELPPAPRDLVPSLALAADHGVPDGPLGANWSLAGASRIERRGANGGTPAFDTTDIFYIDGQRLYSTTGPSQAGYRQEQDDNRIFTRSTGETSNHWTAKRDGWTWYYGQFQQGAGYIGRCATETPYETYPCDDNDGEAITESTSTAWLLSRIVDPAGNIIDFQYTGEAGFTTGAPSDWIADGRASHQLRRIFYGGNNVEVQFLWEAREDTSFVMRGGTPWTLAARLDEIQVRTGGSSGQTYIGGYRFKWLDEDVTASSPVSCPGETLPAIDDVYGSYLHRILRVGDDGSERQIRCIEVDSTPTSFGSANSSTPYGSPGLDPVSYVPFPNDLDGDGTVNLSYLEYRNTSGATWTLTNCAVQGLCELDTALIEASSFGIVDLDGNGVADVYSLEEDYSTTGAAWLHRVYYRNGSFHTTTIYDDGTVPATELPSPSVLEEAQFVDIDGDGLADLVTNAGWYPNSGESPWFLEAEFVPGGTDWWSNVADDWVASITWTQTQYGAYTEEQARWGDFNGDGLADFAYFTHIADHDGWLSDDPMSSLYDPPSNEFYSRIFYGDGTGAFVTTARCEADDLCAGQYYDDSDVPDEISWATPDLDGDLRTELLVENIYQTGSDAGIEDGWTNVVTHVPGGALEDVYHCLESSSQDQSRQSAIVDVDGDGFPDVFQIEVDHSGNTRMDTYWLNQRTRARGRVHRIHDAWGGVIELDYARSTNVGRNGELPFSVEVIRTVEDAQGTSVFTFSGGTFDDRRFQGFSDVLVREESGGYSYYKFAVSTPFDGALIYEAEHRSDTTLAHLIYHDYMLSSGSAWLFDDEPPYFNPITRTCSFDVGPGYSSGGSVAQTVTVEELAEQCSTGFLNITFSSTNFGVVYGWDRHPVDVPGNDGLSSLAEEAWVPDGVAGGTFTGDLLSNPSFWNPQDLLTSALSYRPLDVAPPDEIAVPSQPEAPPIASGTNPTEVVERMVVRGFDSDQRLERVTNRGIVSTTGDERTTEIFYQLWGTTPVGKQLQRIEVTDTAGGSYTKQFSGYVAFGLPTVVVESGTGTGGTASRTTQYAYDRGVVDEIIYGDGSTESRTINSCGYYDTRTDGEGRVEEIEWDAACQQTRREWEGSVETFERDAFGRLAAHTTNPLVAGYSPPVRKEMVYDDEIDDADDRDDWLEPRMGARFTNGTVTQSDDYIELSYLDPWGRQAMVVRCADGGPSSGNPDSEVLSAMSCDSAGPEQRVWRGWATDGTPRATSRGYEDGASNVAATWTYADSIGNLEQELSPSPVSGVGSWENTTYQHHPARMVRTDPVDTICTAATTATTWQLDCEGHTRGARTYDAWGQMTAEENGEGERFEYLYDGLGRRTTKRLWTTIPVWGGSAQPQWTWTYNAVDKPLTETDAHGNQTSWTYDGASRPLTATYYTGVLGGVDRTMTTWEYFEYSGTSTSRRVKSTDVNGNVTWKWLDGLDRTWKTMHPDLSVEEQVWDGGGQIGQRLDPNGVLTTFDYDARGFPATRTVAGTFTTTFDYDAAGDLVGEVDPYGVETVTEYTWDGRPAVVSRPYNGGASVWNLAEWTYREDGLPTTVYADGVASELVYDELGRKAEAYVGGDAADWRMYYSWTYDDADRVTTVTRASEEAALASLPPETTTIHYNDMGWPFELLDSNLDGDLWVYDVLGQVRAHSDADNVWSYWTYDGWGRVLTEALPGQGTRNWSYTFATSDGELHSRTEPDTGVWDTWYDHKGRPVRELWADGTGVVRTYAGDRLYGVEYLDNANVAIASQAYSYDYAGRLHWAWGPFAGAYSSSATPGAGDWYFEYVYSDAVPGDGEHETTRIAPDGELTTWIETDGVLSQQVITDGVGAPRVTSSFTYDATGFPLPITRTMTDAAGNPSRVTTYEWDRGLRVATTSDQVGTGPVQAKSFAEYDNWGVPLEAEHTIGTSVEAAYSLETDHLGRVVHASFSHAGSTTTTAGTVDYTYSTAGRVTGVDTSWAGGFVYNRSGTSGLVTSVTDGASTTYASITSRDNVGRPTGISISGGAATIAQGWDTMGRIDTWTADNGVSVDERTWSYDARGRPETVTHDDASGVWSEDREYEEPGWLVREQRLSHATSPATVLSDVGFQYDSAGNRLQMTESGIPTRTYAYDGSFLDTVDGDPVSWKLDGISVDHRGTQIDRYADGSEATVAVPLGSTYDIIRDPWGRPILTDDGTDVREQVWGNPGGAWPLAGVDENGDPTLYVAADGLLLGMVVNGGFVTAGNEPSGSLAFVGSEWMGVAQSFGEGVGTPTSSTARHVYAGLELLPGTAYHLAQHRLYDSEAGRFTSMDPMGLAGGPNRFTYAENDPARFIDPAGYSATCGGVSLGDFGFEGRKPPAYIEGPAGGPATPFYGGAPVRVVGLSNMHTLDSWAYYQQAQAYPAEWLAKSQTDPSIAAAIGVQWVESAESTTNAADGKMGSFDEKNLMAGGGTRYVKDGVVMEGFHDDFAETTFADPVMVTPDVLVDRASDYDLDPIATNTPVDDDAQAPTEQAAPTDKGPKLSDVLRENGYYDGDPVPEPATPATEPVTVPSLGKRVGVAYGAAWHYWTDDFFTGWEVIGNDFGYAMDNVGDGLLDMYGSLPTTQIRAGNYDQAIDTLAGGVADFGDALGNTVLFPFHVVINGEEILSGDEARALNGYTNQMAVNADVFMVVSTAASLTTGMGSPCNSFAEGTPVLTPNGFVPIEELRPGDMVWAEDPETGEAGFRRVLQVVRGREQAVLAIRWQSGGFGYDVIEATPLHPFFVEGRGWVDAEDLEPGDRVHAVDGRWLTVDGVEPVFQTRPVYNLEVEGLHTFFAGADGALVHNGPPCGVKFTSRVSRSGVDTGIRDASFGGRSYSVNTRHSWGHGHKSGIAPSGTGVSMDALESAFVKDLDDFVQNGGTVPPAGAGNFDRTITIDGASYGYRSTTLPTGEVRITTYWVNP